VGDASSKPDSVTTEAVGLSTRWVWPRLAIVSLIVCAAGLAVELLRQPLGLPNDEGFVPYFSLSYEENVPTYYSAALLASCAVLLAISARNAKLRRAKYVAHWWVLAGGFTYMSLDESIEIHEHMAFFKTSGALYFSWIIPASAVVLLVGVSFIRFLRHLSSTTRWLFVASGTIYVLGAVGFELPLGYWTSHHGKDNLGYALIDWGEETLEIVGAQLFLYSLFRHLAAEEVKLEFVRPGGAP
jgi:hypothetical protein